MEVHFLQRAFDESGLVAHDFHSDVRRNGSLQFREPFLHTVDDLDRVAAGLLAHDERHAVQVVRLRQRARFLDAILDLGHILEIHRLSRDVGDDDLAKVLHALHPAQGPQDQLARFLVHAPARHFEILPQQRLAQIVNGEVIAAQFFVIDRHLHRAGAGARHIDRANILDGFEVLLDELVRDIGYFFEIARRAHADGNDRLGVHVELVDDRGIGARGQGGKDRVDLVAHVLRGDVAIALELKLHGDGGHAFESDAAEFVNALHGVNDLL